MSSETSTQFFEYVSGYSVPVTPKNPISEEQAKQRRAYCVVGFDDFGRVVRVTKWLNAALEFQYDYQYGSDGRVVGAQVTGAAGVREEIPLPRSERKAARAGA